MISPAILRVSHFWYVRFQLLLWTCLIVSWTYINPREPLIHLSRDRILSKNRLNMVSTCMIQELPSKIHVFTEELPHNTLQRGSPWSKSQGIQILQTPTPVPTVAHGRHNKSTQSPISPEPRSSPLFKHLCWRRTSCWTTVEDYCILQQGGLMIHRVTVQGSTASWRNRMWLHIIRFEDGPSALFWKECAYYRWQLISMDGLLRGTCGIASAGRTSIHRSRASFSTNQWCYASNKYENKHRVKSKREKKHQLWKKKR